MVTYTYHGDGSVTVSTSEGQTGGSGFGSEGTYSSEGAARSAVSSGTREGAKENVQLEAKRKMLESPKAQWASQEAYEAAYTSYLRAGGAPISHPAGVIPGSTPEERRAEVAAYDAREASPQAQQPVLQAQQGMLRNPFAGQMLYDVRPDPYAGVRGIPGKEWLEKTREGKVLHYLPGEGYGWRYPEPTQKEKVVKGVIPADIRMSDISSNFYRQAQDVANSIRSADEGFVRAPGFDPGADLWKLGKESVARSVEFVGIIPGTVEVIGQVAVKKPSALPMMGVVGGLSVVGGIAKQAETEPAQLISDVVVTAGIFRGGGMAKTKLREAIPYDISIRKPAGILVDVGKVYAPKVETPSQVPGLIPRVTEIRPETAKIFAEAPLEGHSNIYMRATQEQIGKIQAQAIVGKPQYVSTEYGSFMKVSIEGMKESLLRGTETVTNPTKQIGFTDKPTLVEKIVSKFSKGKEASLDVISSLQDHIRIERKLDIYPAELKLGEPTPPRPQIPERTFDMDIYPEGYTPEKPYYGAGETPGVFGGKITGTAERAKFMEITKPKQLTPARLKTTEELFPRTTIPEGFKTLFPSTKEIMGKSFIPERTTIPERSIETFGDMGGRRLQVETRTAPKSTLETMFSERPFELKPMLQTGIPQKTLRKVSVAEHEDTVLESLKRLQFPKPKLEIKTKVTIKTKPKTFTSEKIKIAIPLSFDKDISAFKTFISPKQKPIPGMSKKPFVFIRPSPKEAPFPYPEPSSFPEPKPYPKTFPEPSPYPRLPSTPRYPGPRLPSTLKPPVKPPVFVLPKMPKFDGMGVPRKTKGRKASAYEIRNPLAGLKELIGDIGYPTARKGKTYIIKNPFTMRKDIIGEF